VAVWLQLVCVAFVPSRPIQPTVMTGSTNPIPAHVVMIVMENHEYGSIIDSAAAPYTNRLASRFVLLTRYVAIRHPSLPNYLALTGGSTFGITTDCTSCSVRSTNIVDQLERHGLAWKAYMEGLPQPCDKRAFHGGYAKKHDPFMYYVDVRTNPARCKRIVPLSRLGMDLSNGTLPRFAWITPNLCHDMHDCSVKAGDRWLRAWVPKILPALQPNGLLLLTWDEGTTGSACCAVARGGHVVAVVAGPGARRGVRLTAPSDHYSLLRLVEEALHLALIRNAARAPQISGYRR
jgi:hypothetical protein